MRGNEQLSPANSRHGGPVTPHGQRGSPVAMGVWRRFVRSQQAMAVRFDGLLPAIYRVDGNRDFRENFAPRYLEPGAVVLDVGGGKHPFVGAETKGALHLRVIGVDIDADQLRQAPAGAYDAEVCCDVALLDMKEAADIAICQAVLEHVQDTRAAIANMACALKPGGRMILFVPSRHAVFARLNLVLPEKAKKWILFKVFPTTQEGHGFVAYYDRCTPREIASLAKSQGLMLVDKQTYYLSRYFAFFFPLYALWRAWTIVFRTVAGDQAAETFSFAFEKPRRYDSTSATAVM